DGENLLDLEFCNRFQVGPGELANVVIPEDFLRQKRAGGNAFREGQVDVASCTFLSPEPDPEGSVFEQTDETASETQKVGSPDDEGLEELFQIADRGEFGGDLKELMQLVCLVTGGGIQFRVCEGNCSEAGDR